jgi:folate-dependent phosphoribosylglycinamide formyltransferase PurN
VKIRAAVFASGGGSNFQALLDRQKPDGTWSIVLLVTDREDAGAIDRAAAAIVPCAVVPTSGRDPAEVANDLLQLLARHRVDLILLAGYVKLIPPAVVARLPGRMF